MFHGRFVRILGLVLLILAGFGVPGAHALGPAAQTEITIGRATDHATRTQKQLQPLADYLAVRLDDVGIKHGNVLVSADNRMDTLIGYLWQGKIDLVITTPFPSAVYNMRAGMTPLVMAKRKGSFLYRSFIFVRRDSGIKSLGDLVGRVIAFEDPGSTSAYFLPLAEMKCFGYNLTALHSSNERVPEGSIGYVFAGSEINISTWAYFGRVAGGTLSSSDWSNKAKLPPPYRDKFRIIYQTREIPRMLISVRRGMDKRLLQRIRQELLRMHRTADGKAALASFGLEEIAPLPDTPDRIISPITELMSAAGMEFRR